MAKEYKSYSEKLKDPRWQKKRLEILNRDNFTCQLCSAEHKTLNVHHLKYSNGNPWDIEDKFLITYCEHCHKMVEHFKNWVDIKLITNNMNDGKSLFMYNIYGYNIKTPAKNKAFYQVSISGNYFAVDTCLYDYDFAEHTAALNKI